MFYYMLVVHNIFSMEENNWAVLLKSNKTLNKYLITYEEYVFKM